NFRRQDGAAGRAVTIRSLTLENTSISYHDAPFEISAYLRGSSRVDGIYQTRLGLAGQWRKTEFVGLADTGGTISLRGSAEPFPIRLTLDIGRTSIRAEGHVADITRFQHIDTMFSISGPSLATLYPTLRLALPETPPYRATGHLRRDGNHYSYEKFTGTIGETDVSGDAQYEIREPRPLLTAKMTSRRLDIKDLGPLVGFGPRNSVAGAEAAAGNATAANTAPPSDKVLPQINFNRERLGVMDADVTLSAASLRIPEQVPLKDFKAHLRLVDGVLTLDPVNFGFAGGNIVSTITLDSHRDPIAGTLALDMRRVRLSELFPTVERMNQSGGRLGAQVRLTGNGNSVAELLGSSNGNITAGMAGGRISEIAVWMANLHGGELIPLLFGGDRPTRIRCGAFAMDVKAGVGTVESFVFDTEESRLDGTGQVNLRNEQFQVVLRPEPKKPGLLSLRGPIRIEGTFRKANFGVAPESLARAIGAVALGIVNPFLALIPLIETGPGEDADCREVLAPVRSAIRQSGQSISDAPGPRPKGARSSPATIVDVPPRSARAAPIIDVAPK
ncbi:MAG TPA: AsmA family protein, partial [Pseudomonadales bacterium]